ncbi:MAG: dethiobiotin synthase [Gammaproteobacteria bacterium]|nr:dethiobiotin synthase [Gammaproteobacteria bacterium]NNJ91924.1 dethiobiotin synthase [Gammaproteobacteria bacterium]
MPILFVSGTDTDAGKTLVTLGLMHALQAKGLRVNGMKPVAAGVSEIGGEAVNDDALLIRQQSSKQLDYKLVNPYLFEPAIAPHIAAQQVDQNIDLKLIQAALDEIEKQSDLVVVEGAGGWLVPLNEQQDVADIAVNMNLPVILVVGLKLGCINHARLSIQAIQARGCRVIGWIGSQIAPEMMNVDENIETLQQYLPVKCLGIVPWLENSDAETVATYIESEALLDQFGIPAK